MKEQKICNAYEYVVARSQFLDPLKPHLSDEQYENAQGDFCCVHYDLVQFENAKSVRQVYDALLSYLLNIEINVSEQLGHITVREDYDYVEKSVSNYRLLSSVNGAPIETNGVMFSKYYESHEMPNGAPCGVVTVDCVDEDALYPYTPSERIRKDTTAAIVLTPCVRTRLDGEDGLVVAMARGKFMKLHHAEFEVAPHTVQQVQSGIADWWQVMIKAVNDMLAAPFS